jgi:hypothetical protein
VCGGQTGDNLRKHKRRAITNDDCRILTCRKNGTDGAWVEERWSNIKGKKSDVGDSASTTSNENEIQEEALHQQI